MIKQQFIASILAFMMTSIPSWAQPTRAHVNEASYIHFEHNKLHFPGAKTAFNQFFEKMKNLAVYGEGQIRILHMGGSHIQADIYSNRMRNHLSNFLPNLMSARGMIFPFTTAKTNNPRSYKASSTGRWTAVRNVDRTLANPLGLSGISVSTLDTNATLTFTFDTPRETQHDFIRLKVLHNTDSASYEIKWLGADSARITKADGYTLLEFENEQTEITLGFEKTDSIQIRFELYGVVLESNRPGFIYTSVGVNGASTWSYLKCELFSKHLSIIPPDLVFFGIGINDAHDPNFSEKSYFANYEKIINQMRAVNPDVCFIFITNNDSYGYNKKLNTNASIVQKVMFDLAKKYDGAVWDLFSIMGGLKSSTAWRDANLMAKDRIHFSGEGYTLLGDLLFNAFMEAFEDYLKTQAKLQ
jgi:lysophospholipase L1-like esterase